MMRRVKETFDPRGLFNPGKIIDTPPMDTSLRHGPDHPTPEYKTVFNFGATQGVLPRRREVQRRRRVPQDPPHGRHDVPELHGRRATSRTPPAPAPTCSATC
jgi:hypothetical protein